jgi:hypothetical protein
MAARGMALARFSFASDGELRRQTTAGSSTINPVAVFEIGM